MNRLLLFVLISILGLSVQHCADTSTGSTNTSAKTAPPDPIFTPITLDPKFGSYWYQGKAELTSYDVVQERYGETRKAEQVNIFVTEDFSKSKHVKLDDAGAAGADRVPILKLNAVRRFQTGLYDYSLMESIFTPISGMQTLKTTATVQDWCGHVFMQSDLTPEGYRARVFSYFESEGDQDLTVPVVLLEEELWTRLRLNPASIKTGPAKVLPAALYTRLRHKSIAPQDADIQIVTSGSTSTLTLQYNSIPRSLSIQFESNFPHKIMAWEEKNEGKIASKGTLKATRMSPYWSEHDNVHAPLRDSLKLEMR